MTMKMPRESVNATNKEICMKISAKFNMKMTSRKYFKGTKVYTDLYKTLNRCELV